MKKLAFLSNNKTFILSFSIVRTAVLTFFCFSLYKMVDIEYIPDNYKSLKINIWAIIKRLWLVERQRFHVRLSISGRLNTGKVKKILLLLAGWYSTC